VTVAVVVIMATIIMIMMMTTVMISMPILTTKTFLFNETDEAQKGNLKAKFQYAYRI